METEFEEDEDEDETRQAIFGKDSASSENSRKSHAGNKELKADLEIKVCVKCGHIPTEKQFQHRSQSMDQLNLMN